MTRTVNRQKFSRHIQKLNFSNDNQINLEISRSDDSFELAPSTSIFGVKIFEQSEFWPLKDSSERFL